MPNQPTDPARSLATQPYRASRTAQLTARRLRDEPIAPHPPTAQIRVYEADGRETTIHLLTDVLGPRALALLAALDRKGGRQ